MQSSTANNSETSVKQETKGTSTDPILVPPGGSNLLLYDLPACAKWVFGSILYLVIPAYKRILRIEDALEEEVINVAEIIKKVAEVTKKVSSDVAEALPADSSLKQLANKVEGKAEIVYMDSEKVEAFIHKVDDIKDVSEAWLKKIAEEWVLIMPEEGIQLERENNLNKEKKQ